MLRAAIFLVRRAIKDIVSSVSSDVCDKKMSPACSLLHMLHLLCPSEISKASLSVGVGLLSSKSQTKAKEFEIPFKKYCDCASSLWYFFHHFVLLIQVFQASLKLLKMIITQYVPKHKLGKLETSHCVEKTLPGLLSRTGDSSSRLRIVAAKFIQVGAFLCIAVWLALRMSQRSPVGNI